MLLRGPRHAYYDLKLICDVDMQPSDTTISYKVSLFLYLCNNKTYNWLLPNIGIPMC